MAVGVSARTAFSLLLPPIVEEYGWDRATVAGASSFGFFLFAVASPLVGRAMDHWGPSIVVGFGAIMVGFGNLLAPLATAPWHFYLTLGLLVGARANLTGYTGPGLYVPPWLQKRRGLAISIAFSGVGAGAILLLPWMQSVILADGWRAACQGMGLVTNLVVGPMMLLVRRRPEDLGLQPDGGTDGAAIAGGAAGPWITGAIHDATDSYAGAFRLAAAMSEVSAAAIWITAPRTIRAVPGRAPGA